MAAERGALSNATITLYALPGAGVNFLYTLILVMYMNFATDALGVAPGALGAIFFAARIWDAVSDPIAGRLSDRTLAQRGRRKTWLIASSLPLSKVATGIMLGLVGLVLEWVGFEAGTPPSDAARFGMLFLDGRRAADRLRDRHGRLPALLTDGGRACASGARSRRRPARLPKPSPRSASEAAR